MANESMVERLPGVISSPCSAENKCGIVRSLVRKVTFRVFSCLLAPGGRLIGEIKIETFQQAISEADDDFEALRGEEDDSSGTTSLSLESSPLDPEKPWGARQQEEVQKKKCTRRRRRTPKKKSKYYPVEKKHTCPECGHKSHYYSDLVRHMKSHAAKELYECLECGKTYRGRSSLENHQKIHLPPDDASRHVKTAGMRKSGCQMKEEHTCFKCGAVKSSQSALTKHMNVHTDERPYECPECGKLFKWRSNMTRHRGLHTYRRFSSRQLMRRGESVALRSMHFAGGPRLTTTAEPEISRC